MTKVYVKQVLDGYPNYKALPISRKKKCECCGGANPRRIAEWRYTDYICDACFNSVDEERGGGLK